MRTPADTPLQPCVGGLPDWTMMLTPEDAGGDEAKSGDPAAARAITAAPTFPLTRAVVAMPAPAADDPAAAKLAAAGIHVSAPVEVPVVNAVEVADTRAIPDLPWATRRPGSDRQVVCADVSLRVSAAILLLLSVVCFGVAVSVAHATAELWRGALVVWGACPQLLFSILALTALISQCRCERRAGVSARARASRMTTFFFFS